MTPTQYGYGDPQTWGWRSSEEGSKDFDAYLKTEEKLIAVLNESGFEIVVQKLHGTDLWINAITAQSSHNTANKKEQLI